MNRFKVLTPQPSSTQYREPPRQSFHERTHALYPRSAQHLAGGIPQVCPCSLMHNKGGQEHL